VSVLNGLRVSQACRADVEDLRREPGGGPSLVVRGKGEKDVCVLRGPTAGRPWAPAGVRSQLHPRLPEQE
jgi:site-specific recombinase XerD